MSHAQPTRRPSRPSPALVLLATLLASATAPALAQDESAPAAAAPTAADLLKSADDVARQVEELTGRKFKQPVPKSVLTKQDLRQELARLMQKEYGKGRVERLEAWLRALGLLQGERDLRATMTDVLLSQIGGFYDPARKSFFMMAETAVYGDVINRTMVAHELCHALDDQYTDLDKLLHPGRELSEDETYVVSGVVEGNATVLMMRYMAQAMRTGAKLTDLAKAAEQQKDQMEVLLAAPPYCALLAANYMVGMHFMTKGAGATAENMGTAPGDAMLEVVAAMPRSSEQLLHPDKYWNKDARDEPVLLADDAAIATLLEQKLQCKVLERNTLGELVAALVAGPAERRLNAALMARADYWTNKASKGWGGDRLFLLGTGGGTEGHAVEAPGVLWVTAWDTVADREEFVAAVTKYRGEQPGFDVAAAGRVAVFAFGSARRLGGDGLQAVLAAAEFTQDGRPFAR